MNIWALLAGLFSGVIASMGLGGGAILIIYLNLFTDTNQLTAQGINLLFFIPIAIASVIVYTKKGAIKWKLALKIAFWGLIGAGFGLLLTNILSTDIIRKLFGAGLIILGLKETFLKVLKKRKNNDILKKE